MFVPILTDMFNHWFVQGVVALLRVWSHYWRKVAGMFRRTYYSAKNTELKILARVLANPLQLVISDLIGTVQNNAVKGRSIQDNLHLVRKILEGLKDDTKAALINLVQSKVLEGSKPMVRRQVYCQRTRNGGLGMPDLESHWLAERQAYLGWFLPRDTVWGQKVRDVFPCLESDPEAKGRHKPKGAATFTHKYRKALRKRHRSSDLSRSRKELYR